MIGKNWSGRILDIRQHDKYGIYVKLVYVLPFDYVPTATRHLAKDNELFQTNEIHIAALSTIQYILGDDTLEYESRTLVVSERPLRYHSDYVDHYKLLSSGFSVLRKMARKRAPSSPPRKRLYRKGNKSYLSSRHS